MTKLHILKATTALISAAVLVGCGGQSSTGDKSASGEMRALGTVDPQIWPKVESPVGLDADMEARITMVTTTSLARQYFRTILDLARRVTLASWVKLALSQRRKFVLAGRNGHSRRQSPLCAMIAGGVLMKAMQKVLK